MHSLNLQLSLPSLPLHLFLPKSQDDVGVSQQGLLRGFPTTTSPCSHTDLAQCQAKSLASLSATSPKPAMESDHNSPGSRCLSENTGEIGTKKPENAGCTQRPQNQEEVENPSSSANNRPQRLSRGDESSSGIAVPHFDMESATC